MDNLRCFVYRHDSWASSFPLLWPVRGACAVSGSVLVASRFRPHCSVSLRGLAATAIVLVLCMAARAGAASGGLAVGHMPILKITPQKRGIRQLLPSTSVWIRYNLRLLKGGAGAGAVPPVTEQFVFETGKMAYIEAIRLKQGGRVRLRYSTDVSRRTDLFSDHGISLSFTHHDRNVKISAPGDVGASSAACLEICLQPWRLGLDRTRLSAFLLARHAIVAEPRITSRLRWQVMVGHISGPAVLLKGRKEKLTLHLHGGAWPLHMHWSLSPGIKLVHLGHRGRQCTVRGLKVGPQWAAVVVDDAEGNQIRLHFSLAGHDAWQIGRRVHKSWSHGVWHPAPTIALLLHGAPTFTLPRRGFFHFSYHAIKVSKGGDVAAIARALGVKRLTRREVIPFTSVTRVKLPRDKLLIDGKATGHKHMRQFLESQTHFQSTRITMTVHSSVLISLPIGTPTDRRYQLFTAPSFTVHRGRWRHWGESGLISQGTYATYTPGISFFAVSLMQIGRPKKALAVAHAAAH